MVGAFGSEKTFMTQNLQFWQTAIYHSMMPTQLYREIHAMSEMEFGEFLCEFLFSLLIASAFNICCSKAWI